MTNPLPLSAMFPATLGLLGALSCAAPTGEPREAAPGETAARPEPPPSEFLLVRTGGLDAFLVDERDAGLKRALSMADERVLELVHETGAQVPKGAIDLAFAVFRSPLTLRASIADGQMVPVHGQLEVATASPEEAGGIAQTLASLLQMGAPPGEPDPDHAGLERISLPPGTFRYGAAEGSADLLLAFGDLDTDEPVLTGPELPHDAEPALFFRFDAGPIAPLVQGLLAQAGEEAEAARVQLEFMGLLGETPPRITAAAGNCSKHSHGVCLWEGWAANARTTGYLAAAPLTKEDLRNVPADATFASVSKIDVVSFYGNLLTTMDPDTWGGVAAQAEAFLGIDLEADLCDTLGTTSGFFLSDTTGGGGLTSAVLFFSVVQEEVLRQTIDHLVGLGNDLAMNEAEGRVQVRAWEHRGTRCQSLAFPGLPIPCEPSSAISDGYLFLAATPQGLMAALDHRQGRGEGLLDAPGVDDFVGSLRDVHGVTYFDAPSMIGDGYGLAVLGFSALSNAVRSPADGNRDPGQILPPLGTLREASIPSISVNRVAGDDLLIETRGDRSVVAGLTAVAGSPIAKLLAVGVAAGVAVPAVMAKMEAESGMVLEPEQPVMHESGAHDEHDHGEHDHGEHDHGDHDHGEHGGG